MTSTMKEGKTVTMNDQSAGSGATTASSTPQQPVVKKTAHPAVHFVAGGIGGTVGAVVTCPLEVGEWLSVFGITNFSMFNVHQVIKTRMQSSQYQTEHGKGVGTMLRTIYKNEGVSGLWRGIGPNLVGVMPARAIYFSTYASTKQYLTHDVRLNDGQESSLIHLLSASAAVFATSTLTNPIWLIKTRLMLQKERCKQQQLPGSAPKPTAMPAATVNTPSRITRTSSRIATAPVGFFTIKQQPKMSLSSARTLEGLPQIVNATSTSSLLSTPKPLKSKHLATFTTSAISSSSSINNVATTLTNDIYYKNSFDCLRKVIKQEGIRGLFRGMGASYLGVIETSTQWIVYERLKMTMAEYRASHPSERIPDNDGKPRQKKAPFADYFLTAAVAKTMATLLSYPHEVIRTRLRQVVTVPSSANASEMTAVPRYTGISNVVRTILREEGGRAFYGGLTAHLLRTVPNAAIMFLCYEWVVHVFE